MQSTHTRKATLALTASVIVLATAASAAAQSVSPAKSSTGQDVNVVEEIVVTASKRAERLQDAPISVSAIKSDTLDKLGIANFADLSSLVPNLNLAGGQASGVGTVVIRGLYSGNFQTNATSATYIGETPFTANSALSSSGLINPDPDLLDVDRVEVLKGPQGTLYGASSLGGLVRILPKQPDTTGYSGQIRVDGQSIDGGGNGGGVRASVNIPLSSWAALRVSGLDKQDPGFTTNLKTGHQDLGNTNASGGSAALKVDAAPNLELDLNGLYESTRTRGLQQQDDIPGTGTPRYAERTYSFPIDGGSRSIYWLLDGTARYKAELGTLTGAVSYAHYDTRITQDATYTYGVLEPTVLGPTGNVALTAAPIADKSNVELRFASKRFDNIEFIAGLFYTDEKTRYPVQIQNQSAPGVPFALPGAFSFLNNIANLNSLDHYKEYAAFGDLTYYLTDKLDVTGGLRYSHNDQVVREVIQPGILPLGPNTTTTFNDDSTVFQASARYRPNSDMSLYLRVASGYRPGGAQVLTVGAPGIPTSYSPDTTVTYEGGVKGKMFDHRLIYDVSAYHTDWTDIHLTGVAGGVGYTLNGGDATVNGFEGQVDWYDPSGLHLGSSVGLADSELTRVLPNVTASVGAVSGDRLPGSPRWTASAYADYRHKITEQLTGTVGATVLYQGDKVSSYPGAVKDLFYQIPAYTTLNLRAGVEWGNYSLNFIADNVTDVNGITGYYVNSVLPIPNPVQPGNAYLTRPRTYKISLSAKF